MQSDNATNFKAEIAHELMKASQVTKVTSTPAHGIQSGNATNVTAEIARELMKASQVTKVTSSAAHPRSNRLVERQN